MLHSARSIRQVFIFSAIALMVITSLLVWAVRNLTTSYQRVIHTWEVQYRLQQVVIGLKNAESGVRGYLISGDPTLLDAKRELETNFQARMSVLDSLVRNNTAQQSNLALLKRLLQARLDVMQQGVYDYSSPEGLKKEMVIRGSRITDQIEYTATKMLLLEEQSLADNERMSDLYTRRMPIYLLGLAALLLVGTGFLMYRLLRQFNDLKKVQGRLKETNNDLEAQKKTLEKTNEELESFNYIASHDLKEPVRKIRTFASILEKQEEAHFSESGKQILHKLSASAEKIQTMLDDLLVYTQLRTLSEASKDVPMQQLVQKVWHNLGDLVQENDAQLETEHLPVVHAIPFQMEQLMENLLHNALKFARPGVAPHIRIKGEGLDAANIAGYSGDHRHFHCISIQDNGIGFPQAYAPKVFEIFTRLHSKSHPAGTGLGLTICKKIVENHGGLIDVESAEDKGTTFRVYLPA